MGQGGDDQALAIKHQWHHQIAPRQALRHQLHALRLNVEVLQADLGDAQLLGQGQAQALGADHLQFQQHLTEAAQFRVLVLVAEGFVQL